MTTSGAPGGGSGARRRLDPLDRFGIALIVAWLAWVLIVSLLTGRLGWPGPLVAVPLVAVAGVAAGRALAARARTWPLAEMLFGVGVLTALSAAMTRGPGKLPTLYANA
ncbi:MAG: hypothetical protein ACLGHZ_02505, partial [Actinomycetes bacterium]